MQITVKVQTMDLPEETRRTIEAACDGKKPHSWVSFDDYIINYHGPRCPRIHGLPINNLLIGIPVPDIDDGTELPNWMKGVDHQVELTETTGQGVQNGRYRFGGARGEVNTYQTPAGYNTPVTTTKIRINARGKHAYKQALALLGKIRSGELVKKYHENVASNNPNRNVIELWG